ncbi:MAG: glycosyltransferase family 25 protein, partial [Rubrivivax sp.]|nr:glycosyltransferase family 25 protein [Rubrivivax sp.]
MIDPKLRPPQNRPVARTRNKPPIFIINLERSTQRHAVMEKRLNELALEHKFITATNGRNLMPSERALSNPVIRDRFARTPLTDAEIGCYLSHLKLW